eukprot:602452-Heterocapsa_arctica.AAC.1
MKSEPNFHNYSNETKIDQNGGIHGGHGIGAHIAGKAGGISPYSQRKAALHALAREDAALLHAHGPDEERSWSIPARLHHVRGSGKQGLYEGPR